MSTELFTHRRLGGPGTRVRMPFLKSESGRAKAIGAVALICLVIALIAFASTLTFVIPAPWDTAVAIKDNLSDADYVSALGVTVKNIVLGFAIGFTVGLMLGCALGLSDQVRRATEPSVMAANAMPVIVLYPLIIPILTIGSASKIAMGALMAVFPVALTVVGALRSLPPIYRRLGRSMRLPRWRVLAYILVPSIRRQLLAGARIGFGVATIGVILSEFFAARIGLGVLIRRDYELARYPEMMGSVTLLIVAAFAIAFLLWRLERNLD